jgi:DNA-directed RNA polymerase specialized sigma24 family protein
MKSTQDIGQALLALTEEESLRLRSYAQWRIRGLGRKAQGMVADDLLQEAMVATLDGRRVWKEGVSLFQHLIGTIRSISSSLRAKKFEEYLESEIATTRGEMPLGLDVTTMNPQRILEAKVRLAEVMRPFENDPQALKVINHLAAGLSAKEIQYELKIGHLEYQAIAKRIRRKLRQIGLVAAPK